MICMCSYLYPNGIFWYLMHALNDDLGFYLVSCFTDWAEDCFLCYIFFFVPEENHFLFDLWNSELSLSDDRIRCIKFNVDYIAPWIDTELIICMKRIIGRWCKLHWNLEMILSATNIEYELYSLIFQKIIDDNICHIFPCTFYALSFNFTFLLCIGI